MTVNDLLKLSYGDIVKLDTQQAREVLKAARKVSKGRMTRLSKAGLESPAMYEFQRRGGTKGGVNKLSLNEVRSEIQSNLYFLRAKTSLVTGARKAEQRLNKTITSLGVDALTDAQRRRLWAVYKKYQRNISREQMKAIYGGSDKVIRQIADVINENKGIRKYDDILSMAEERLQDLENEGVAADETSAMVRIARDE